MEYAETTINNLLNKDLNKLIDDTTFLNSFGKNENIVISILKLCKYQGYTIAGLWNYFKTVKGLSVSYSKIYRIVEELENKKFLDADGVGLYYTTQGGSSFLLDTSSSETSTIPNNRDKPNFNGGWNGINDKKNWIISKMQNILKTNTFLSYENDEQKFKRYDLNFLFIEYILDALEKKLILKRKEGESQDLPPYIILPFQTRFSDERAIKEKLNDFWNNRYNYFTNKHDKAIFLTLTTDLNNFNSLWDATEQLFKNFKKLMDWLNRRHIRNGGSKLDYLYCFEFSPKQCIPHLHIILFGTDYLRLEDGRKKKENLTIAETTKTVYKVSEMWQKYGQGKIVYLYGLKKNKDGVFIWKGRRPKDAKKNDAGRYLAKYITKTLYTIRRVIGTIKEAKNKFSAKNPTAIKEAKKELYKGLGVLPLYLASGKRFIGSSKVPKKKKENKGGSGSYTVLMSCYEMAIPNFIYEAIFNHNRRRKYTAIDYGSHTVYNSSSLGAW